jgi:hypothetical protein
MRNLKIRLQDVQHKGSIANFMLSVIDSISTLKTKIMESDNLLLKRLKAKIIILLARKLKIRSNIFLY